jgi:hypothetical protein
LSSSSLSEMEALRSREEDCDVQVSGVWCCSPQVVQGYDGAVCGYS